MNGELRVDENQMAVAVELALMSLPEPSATFAELREIVPNYLTLHRGDRAKMPSRPGEEKWYQTKRNLIAHPELHPQFDPIPGGMKLVSSSTLEKRIAKMTDELPNLEAKFAAAKKRGASEERLDELRGVLTQHRGVIKHGSALIGRLRKYEKKSSRRTEKAESQKVA